ncbi:MAG: hypothetical protein H8E14_02745 [Candidatus Marinimicrobia bacterium]|nr:hypothetical protein [Candidatus Neomarinimicrobiota bacterium]
MWKYLFTISQVIFKYRSIVREAKEVYQKYLLAKKDGKITVSEMRVITDEVFDVVAVVIPALKELKTIDK